MLLPSYSCYLCLEKRRGEGGIESERKRHTHTHRKRETKREREWQMWPVARGLIFG